jgi:hypothetical protein
MIVRPLVKAVKAQQLFALPINLPGHLERDPLVFESFDGLVNLSDQILLLTDSSDRRSFESFDGLSGPQIKLAFDGSFNLISAGFFFRSFAEAPERLTNPTLFVRLCVLLRTHPPRRSNSSFDGLPLIADL